MTAFEIPKTAFLDVSDRTRFPVTILGIARAGVWVQAPDGALLQFRSKVRVTFPNPQGAIGAIMEVVHVSAAGVGLEVSPSADALIRSVLDDWSEGRSANLSFDPRKMPVESPATVEIDRKKQLEGRSVLIVEDDTSVARVLRAMLQRQGGEVHIAPDGLAAIDIARTKHVDAVLLDWMLPHMGGGRVLDELRRLQPGVPVAVVSGMVHSPAMRSEVRRLGADAVFPKPFTLSQIFDWVSRSINHAA